MEIKKILKWYLLVTSIYLIIDGFVHILSIKLIDVGNWSVQAIVYAEFISRLYGSFAILSGLFGIEASRDLNKYRNFLYIAGVWIASYGAYLIYTSLTTDFAKIFLESPSIYVWMPFYNYYLLFEAALCFILSTLVYAFWKGAKK